MNFGEVPGCSGGAEYEGTADFCVWNETFPKPELPIAYEEFGELEYIGNDGTFYAVYPLKACLGDVSEKECGPCLFYRVYA